ncbi:hypothetical protein PtB15_11B89 [Puccinia triticina]|nr:hypothetical protein PtB15_11B89 [Puccinia triticina]
MASSMSSSPNAISDGLPLVNAMSLTLNPYPLILQTIADQQKSLSHHDLPRFTTILGVVHAILFVVAAATLLLKVFRRPDGERRKIWLWRKHYTSDDQAIPYLVPNGNFVIEALQMLGCTLYLLFVIFLDWEVRYPDSVPDSVRAGMMFWHAVALVPGYIAFWLCGWGAFYVVYLAPGRPNKKSTSSKKSPIEHSLVLNTICISIPVFITVYFFIIGILMTFKLRQTISTYKLVTLTLNQLSTQWKANDPMRFKNNKRLFDIFTTLSEEVNQMISVAQAEAFGGAAVSIVMITFYVVTVLATSRLVKTSILIASGRKSVFQSSESPVESRETLRSSTATRDSKTKSELPRNTFTNYISLTRLQRSYYFIIISCGIMAVALGLNFSTNIFFALKMKVMVIETKWQAVLIDLVTGTTVTLSLSLFLQSLMLSIWG